MYHVPVACFMKVKLGDQVTKKGDQPTDHGINYFQSNGSSKVYIIRLVQWTSPHLFRKIFVDFLTSTLFRAQNTTLLSKIRRRYFQMFNS